MDRAGDRDAHRSRMTSTNSGAMNQVGSDVLRDHLLRLGRRSRSRRVSRCRMRLRERPPWGVDPAWLDSLRSDAAVPRPGRSVAQRPRSWPRMVARLRHEHMAGDHADPHGRLADRRGDRVYSITRLRRRAGTGSTTRPLIIPNPIRRYTILGCRMEFVVTSMREVERVGIATRNNERRARRRGVRCSGDSVVQRQPK